MKNTVRSKFLLLYLFIAAVSFASAVLIGRFIIRGTFIKREAANLYTAATQLEKTLEDTPEEEGLYVMSSTAACNDIDIMILSPRGEVMSSTTDVYKAPEGFDHSSFGPKYYNVGSFFGAFSDERLNVILPVTRDLTQRVYLLMSKPMSSVETGYESAYASLLLMALITSILSVLTLALLRFSVLGPLRKIQRAAELLSDGRLSEPIGIKTKDELGALAGTIEYTASRIKKTADYQKAFIANVSHDFRSPLTSIKGYADAMTDGTIPPEMMPKYIGIIRNEAERLDNLTSSILTLGSIDPDKESLSLTDFDIHAVLKDTVGVFEGRCRKKKLSIELILAEEAVFVCADKEKIKRVIYNLLDNAIKFSSRGGTIKIETSVKHNKCHVSVKDEGCGISKTELPKIWDRFYKGDPSRGRDKSGSGLGLSIVKEIISAHGQNISCVSTEDAGTEFVFTLSLSD